MKKHFILFFVLLQCFLLNAEKYQISDTAFNIQGAGLKIMGTTKEYSILTNYPLDTKTIFESTEDLEFYINNYKQQLIDSRAFESVEITYETQFQEDTAPDIKNIILTINIKDSHHLLALPYLSYNSNDGFTFKLKAKDTNFLGSLNTMNSQITLNIDDGKFIPGLSFAYDHPFKAGIFNATWVNDYSLDYTIGNSVPEWSAKTGLQFVLPFEKISYSLEFYQYFCNDYDYEDWNDNIYFNEEAIFSTPINLYKLPNFTTLKYTPFIKFNYYWDFDGINNLNDYLSSPTLSIGHKLSNSKITWIENFRKGYDFEVENVYYYNFQRNDFVISASFDAKIFFTYKLYDWKLLDQYGIYTDFYFFTYPDLPFNSYVYGNKIGSRLRGILDNSYFGNEKPEYTSSSAIVLNIDLPHHLFKTNFSKEIINFDIQASPFFDMALIYNRNNNTVFSFKDGLYCAGLEFLVFPLKWSSYTIRVSYGFDIKSAAKYDNFFEGILKEREVSFGVGTAF